MASVRGVDLALTDEGSGPAYLWGHGFAGSMRDDSSRMFDWERLSARHRVVRWDARGHGSSPGTTRPSEYRWDELGRDVVALADVLGIGRFAAGGVSMGTATALHAAVAAPDRVAGLVLVLPPTAYETRAAQAADYEASARLVEREGIDAYVVQLERQPVPEILESIASAYHPRPSVPASLFPAVLRGAAQSDLPPCDQVRSIDAPALILAWTGDPGHPLATAELLADLLPDAALHVARRLRDTITWTNEVENFLDRIDTDPVQSTPRS
jgi:pimeloyl-ACP methyl ester carboxylesterase